MVVMNDPHLGWAASSAFHKICMHHLASNFMTYFQNKLLKNLVCRAALAITDECKTHLCLKSISHDIFENFISKFM